MKQKVQSWYKFLSCSSKLALISFSCIFLIAWFFCWNHRNTFMSYINKNITLIIFFDKNKASLPVSDWEKGRCWFRLILKVVFVLEQHTCASLISASLFSTNLKLSVSHIFLTKLRKVIFLTFTALFGSSLYSEKIIFLTFLSYTWKIIFLFVSQKKSYLYRHNRFYVFKRLKQEEPRILY